MLCTFHRAGEQVMYEIRLVTGSSEFEMIIQQPDGTETVERFADNTGVDRRARELQEQLLTDGWWLASDPRR
jgi:hypothetical protein